jgi:membrane-bound serine protease (ClpP class)
MKTRAWWRTFLGAVMLALLGLSLAAGAQAQGGPVVVLTIKGALTPAHAAYLERGLALAERRGAEAVILQLDTPGGQLDLMEQIVAEIRNSSVPVVVFVAPAGATAGSAGTVITLAGHASAMAPQTTIGAASPVGGQGENLDSTLESKLKEITKAKVRSLAEGRPPEAIALAEATIEEARAATAQEAHAIGLVDFLASDVPGLLEQLDGFAIQIDGAPRTLRTAGAAIETADMNAVEQVLNLVTNPNIVALLLFLGAQAVLIELSSPGGWVAGFIGAVSLALAFYGLGVLPVNWFGLIFIGLAFVLFLMEVNAPTHGGLAAAGTASLVAGALVLFNSPGTPSFLRVSVPLVVGTALLVAVSFVTLMTFALRAQRRPPAVGVESLVGRLGEARAEGLVHVAGELWTAEVAAGGEAGLKPGQAVEVVGVRGLKLIVRPK